MDSKGHSAHPGAPKRKSYDQASLRHARRAKMAIIGDFPDDIATRTMLMAANA